MKYHLLLVTVSGLLLLLHLQSTFCKKFSAEEKPEWAKKDIRDYSEADLERLLDQWEEDEEPLPPDELPEHLRPQPNIQFDPNNIGDPESLLKLSKKGKTLMMFVRTKEEFSPEDASAITQRWQTSLWNSHIQAERYMVDDRRAIFMFKDGALAWEAKDFLIEQEELLECTLENRSYYGKFTPEGRKEEEEKRKSSVKKSNKTKKKKEEL